MQSRAVAQGQAPMHSGKIPAHIGIIMDGNGRWAQKRGLPRLDGHRVGVDCIPAVLKFLSEKGIKYLTIYAFSTENWDRPSEEVTGILAILHDALQAQTNVFHENNVRLVHIGQRDRLDAELREQIAHAERLTRNNTGITLNVAFNYGGRSEILNAVRRIIQDGVAEEEVDEELFRGYLFTKDSPDPDLIIRTGGEWRISNFLLWQSAYSEYYHTPTLWPDLDSAELAQVLEEFGNRERRFGRVSPEA